MIDFHCFTGDMTLEIWQNSCCTSKLLISYLFNTAFIDINTPLRIDLSKLSPLCKQRQAHFESTFTITIEFRKVEEFEAAQKVLESQK